MLKVEQEANESGEKKLNVGMAAVALAALVIGIVIGMYIPGGSIGQGRLVLNKDSRGVDETCQQYKMLILSGLISSELEMREIAENVAFCENEYPDFWKATPTFKECQLLKAKQDEGTLSDYMVKRGIADISVKYCGSFYRWIWYKKSPNQSECYIYKEFKDQGILAKAVGRENVAPIEEQCAKFFDMNESELFDEGVRR